MKLLALVLLLLQGAFALETLPHIQKRVPEVLGNDDDDDDDNDGDDDNDDDNNDDSCGSISSLPLPDGFKGEGITEGNGYLYVGSLGGAGIMRADSRDPIPVFEPFCCTDLQPPLVGKAYDPVRNQLFIAQGPLGFAVVAADSGDVLFQYAAEGEGNFINDVIVQGDVAIFTDSFKKEFYVFDLEAQTTSIVPLMGEFEDYTPGAFNANGITLVDDAVIMCTSAGGGLYRVPLNGEATRIPLDQDGALVTCDGLDADGRTVYAAKNLANSVLQFQLNEDLTSARVLAELAFNNSPIPATLAIAGSSLYVVDAQFDQCPPFEQCPEVEFAVTRIRNYETFFAQDTSAYTTTVFN